jgi:general secretion pathway protein J
MNIVPTAHGCTPRGRLRRDTTTGFTLIEALIALGILAIVAVLAYQAMAALSGGELRLAGETERWTSLDAFFSRFETDLRSAVPRAVRHGSSKEPAFAASVDAEGNALLTFSRAGSEFDAEPGIAGQRIGYAQSGNTVEIAYWPALDNVANASPTRYALLTDVAQFRVGYWTREGRWIAQWPVKDEPAVPRALRINIAFTDGTTVERWITLQ